MAGGSWGRHSAAEQALSYTIGGGVPSALAVSAGSQAHTAQA